MKTSLPAESILFPLTDLWIPNLEQHHYLSTDANRKLQRVDFELRLKYLIRRALYLGYRIRVAVD